MHKLKCTSLIKLTQIKIVRSSIATYSIMFSDPLTNDTSYSLADQETAVQVLNNDVEAVSFFSFFYLCT